MRPIPIVALLCLTACSQTSVKPALSYYGTLEPFAKEAVYFVVTDRFVNGDPLNDQREQGGANRSFDRPMTCADGTVDNVGYLGGDFRGLLDSADYIRDMGFSALWITPIIDNPNEAFSGGDPISCGSSLTDRGKSGYHGYWGMNFYRVDEHLSSEGLGFKELADGLHAKGLKVVLDIVSNHASPGFTMPTGQPGFGQVFDADGRLLADHQNLAPEALDANNPLHAFFNRKKDLAQLADLNGDSPAVREYLAGAYLHWIEQGADAFRIDTIRHQPTSYWRDFSDRIRARHPGFFMFGEAFDYDPKNIAPYTWPENGAISVLDFPLKAALLEVFEKPNSSYATLEPALALNDGPFHNPYELTTFYDNHDMARMNATDQGFIDAHNWLFTARGIPVIYYGSEIGFMRGRAEHWGNRNFFGTERMRDATAHPIYAALKKIAGVRKSSIALQRGLQLNVKLQGDHAIFYRVYQHAGVTQTALVMLNKADSAQTLRVTRFLAPGVWQDALSGEDVRAEQELAAVVPAHGVRVFLYSGVAQDKDTVERLNQLASRKSTRN